MQISILGCSGGIGVNLRTTSILIDQDVLIDCGTGIGDLSIEQMKKIKHVFITHSHLDHTAALPLLVDTIFGEVEHPVQVYASAATLKALDEHIFNWVMWPDFRQLPSKNKPSIVFHPLEANEVKELNGRKFHAVAVKHVVPCMGYVVSSPSGGVFAFSGDTKTNDSLWSALNAYPRLNVFIVEAAFDDDMQELAEQAGHYCPASLTADLKKLKHSCDIWVTHLKPGIEEEIMSELAEHVPGRVVHRLTGNETFEL